MAMRCWLADDAATARLSALLASTLPAPRVVHLRGELGAGKSTLARGWLRALGIDGPIRSPTYTLVERYPLAAGGEALHLDLYRIAAPDELEFLGLDDADARLWLVEWPERGSGALPAPDLVVTLDVAAGGRVCTIAFADPTGVDGMAYEALRTGLRGFPESPPQEQGAGPGFVR